LHHSNRRRIPPRQGSPDPHSPATRALTRREKAAALRAVVAKKTRIKHTHPIANADALAFFIAREGKIDAPRAAILPFLIGAGFAIGVPGGVNAQNDGFGGGETRGWLILGVFGVIGGDFDAILSDFEAIWG
jgi:hypothetical protein